MADDAVDGTGAAAGCGNAVHAPGLAEIAERLKALSQASFELAHRPLEAPADLVSSLQEHEPGSP